MSEEKNYNLCIFMLYFEIRKQLGSWQLFCISVTISASLVKLRRRTIFKSKTLPWKTPKPSSVVFFVLIGMAFLFTLRFKINGEDILFFHDFWRPPAAYFDPPPVYYFWNFTREYNEAHKYIIEYSPTCTQTRWQHNRFKKSMLEFLVWTL